MEIRQIITQANKAVELEFRAMERSLRASGCDLPLRVIPYDDHLFELPPNSQWTDLDGFVGRIRPFATHPCHQRYGVLAADRYQYTDTDVIFLRDPQVALSNYSGFVATCTQWRLPQYAVTSQSRTVFEKQLSNWPLKVFNSGQFACDQPVYSSEELAETLSNARYRETFLRKDPPWDQPGFNLLVHLKQPEYTNLTLPPHSMESSFAGDYPGGYQEIWDRSEFPPYLVHWAGPSLDEERPINELFFGFLTRSEFEEWKGVQKQRLAKRTAEYRRSLGLMKRAVYDIKQGVKALAPDVVSRLRRKPSDSLGG